MWDGILFGSKGVVIPINDVRAFRVFAGTEELEPEGDPEDVWGRRLEDVLVEFLSVRLVAEVEAFKFSTKCAEAAPDPRGRELGADTIADRDGLRVGTGGGVSGSALLLPEVEGAGDVLRELDADFELAFRLTILAVAIALCSCEIGAKCTSNGSNSSSMLPDGPTIIICTGLSE